MGGKREAPEDLTREEQLKLWSWVEGQYPYLKKGQVREYVDEGLDWARSNDKRYADWVAFCRNWIRRGERYARERGARKEWERPQERRPKKEEPMVKVGNVVDLLARKAQG